MRIVARRLDDGRVQINVEVKALVTIRKSWTVRATSIGAIRSACDRVMTPAIGASAYLELNDTSGEVTDFRVDGSSPTRAKTG